MSRRHPARQGFSLLEILLALALLGGALAILSQIAYTGVSAAREARDLSMARLLAQTKLSEVLLNATAGQNPVPVFEQAAEAFDSQSTTAFSYSVEVQPAPLDGMLVIRVSTTGVDGNGAQIAKYTLDRWMIDPALALDELELEEEAAREEAAGTAEETGI